ncbi:hypothetical protein QJS04_geneDACA013050 [Acorus gramineus]|uniref:Uncharacterized protein n=1 Tax=Acorus gramineus TaxID=55184 RepID=A0AAV9B118_ACOGR|nr:hypothetical protein QJS04_geneDACA013050 [Acorus gramineus]
MADVLNDVQLYLAHTRTKLSEEEKKALIACRKKAGEDSIVGTWIGYAITFPFLVTKHVPPLTKAGIFLAAGLLGSKLTLMKSLNASIEHLLSLEGSNLQPIVASVILANHRNNARRMKLVDRFFYPEPVFGDTSPDEPISRWRPRSTFVERVAEETRTDNRVTMNRTLIAEHVGGLPEESFHHRKKAHRRHRVAHTENSLS